MYPDRIDFCKLQDNQVNVLKLRQRGYQNTVISHEIKPASFDLNAALDWCQGNGYLVHNWGYGARAWLDEIRPVRTAHELNRLRQALEKEWKEHWARRTEENPNADQPGSRWNEVKVLLQLDLAYDG